MKTNKRNGISSYLDRVGILKNGSIDEVAAAKKEYWRQYKARWRNAQRKRTKQYTLSLTPQETARMTFLAKKHSRSITSFIKSAAFCYVNRTYLVPDVVAIGTIRQLLAVNYAILQKFFDDSFVPFDMGRTLLALMEKLEKTVLAELCNPKQIQVNNASD